MLPNIENQSSSMFAMYISKFRIPSLLISVFPVEVHESKTQGTYQALLEDWRFHWDRGWV